MSSGLIYGLTKCLEDNRKSELSDVRLEQQNGDISQPGHSS